MARGQSRYQAPPASRPSALGNGFLKLKPKASKARTWQALDLDNDDDSESEAPAAKSKPEQKPLTYAGLIQKPRAEHAGDSPNQMRPQTPFNVSADEIIDVFSKRLPDPIYLRSELGVHHGEVQFIQHPNRDVSAHQWDISSFEWHEIGRYSCFRKEIEGLLTPVKKLTVANPHARPHSLAYFRELAEERENVVRTQPFTAVKSDGSKSQLHTKPNEQRIQQQERPKFPFGSTSHEANRYDSLSTVAEASTQDAAFPTLSSFGLDIPTSSRNTAKPAEAPSRQDSAFKTLGSSSADPFAAESPMSPSSQPPLVPQGSDKKNKQTSYRLPGKMNLNYRFPLKADIGTGPSGLAAIGSLWSADGTDVNASPTAERKAPLTAQESQRVRDVLWPTGAKEDTGRASEPVSTEGGVDISPRNFPELQEPTPNREQIPQFVSKLVASNGLRPEVDATNLPFRVTGAVGQTDSSIITGNSSSTSTVVPSDPVPQLPYAGTATHATGFMNLPYEGRAHAHASSVSLLSQGDPEPGYLDRHSGIYHPPGSVIPPTKQNFNGPFFQDVMPTAEEPTNRLASNIPFEEELETWWNSGLLTQRHNDWMKTLNVPAPPGLSRSRDMGISRLLLPVYEVLESYVQSDRVGRRYDYFTRYGTPPEWCIDKSARRNESMFGEDRGQVPKRIGRDPRYRPDYHKPRYIVYEDEEVFWNNSRSKYDMFK